MTADDADRAEIRRLTGELLAAVNASDPARVLAVWSDDGVLMPPNRPAVRGQAALREYFAARFAGTRFRFAFTASELHVAGDVAVERLAYTARAWPAGGSESAEDTGKGLHVYRRQPDGGWKLALDIWNSDRPAVGGGPPVPPTARASRAGEADQVATATVNGVRLRWELAGRGDVPLVLVHGSWASLRTWDLLVPLLSGSFRVLRYDRRGHSESERPPGPGSVREDVADLAALIEEQGLAPAWVVGSSFGASIALRLGAERPELLRGLVAHEPPLFALLAGDATMAPMVERVGRAIGAVVDRIAAGDHAGAAEQFIETVALGPGAWATLPPEIRQTLIGNAPTFLDEAKDPEQLAIDLAALRGFRRPVLLTMGDESPPTFAPVVRKLAAAMPRADVAVFPGAGHIPHVTHPDPYARAIAAFIAKNPVLA